MAKTKSKVRPKKKTKAVAKKAKPVVKKAKPVVKKIKSIPDGYHTATPYLVIRGAAAAIDYYKNAFNALELVRMEGPGGRIGHAEIRIGNSPIMLADEHPEMGARSPHAIGGTPVGIVLYVEDVDSVFDKAIATGATVKQPVEDKFYGDRMGTLTDPFGHQWSIGTHKEDVSPQEMQKRMAAMQGST